MLSLRLLSIGTALLLSASAASATGILDDLFAITQDGVGTMTISGDDLGCIVTESEKATTFACNGSGQTYIPTNTNFTFELSDWIINGDFDPFVSSAFGFLNVGPTATFTIITSIPVAPLGPSTVMGGSTGGSVTDANFDGLGGVSTVAPDAFFTGMIDGVPVVPTAELLSDPFSVGFLFPGHTASIPAVFFGLPGPTTPGPAVAASIGIQNKFSLSGGDSIASTNFFVVEAIPEPSTGLLLAAGLAVLSFRRRRQA